jgi:hypothetical protein
MGFADRNALLGDKMKAVLIVCVLVLCPSCVIAQDGKSLGEIKQWRLHSEHADVDVRLSRASNLNYVLSLAPEGKALLTVAEEANLLRQVTHDMTELRYEPSKLEMISTWLQNSEFQEGVERAIFQSPKWKSCLGRKYCYEAESVANHFLLSVDAFKEFDAVLHEYGLKRKTVRVDDMAVGTRAGGVLCQGLIVIALEKKR